MAALVVPVGGDPRSPQPARPRDRYRRQRPAGRAAVEPPRLREQRGRDPVRRRHLTHVTVGSEVDWPRPQAFLTDVFGNDRARLWVGDGTVRFAITSTPVFVTAGPLA